MWVPVTFYSYFHLTRLVALRMIFYAESFPCRFKRQRASSDASAQIGGVTFRAVLSLVRC